MRKILITSTDLMMIQFLVPHVLYLREQGMQVDVACSEVGGRLEEVRERLGSESVYQVRLVRSPVNPKNLKGLQDLINLLNMHQYDVIWTNEPVMGIMTRLAARKARKKGTKVIYMVHGFHFYEGAPKFNWMVWYPIEKFMSKFCDTIVTVNEEDYGKAVSMPYNSVKYIHGIGINTSRLSSEIASTNIKKELKLPDDSILLIAVGELNKNKNQQVIINALAKITDDKCHLILCGKGEERENLESLVRILHLENRVHFLGYRKDVVDIVKQADIFLMSSFREGLPVASLEAMYCGIPLITSKCRGLVDIMRGQEKQFLCNPLNSDDYSKALEIMIADECLRKKISCENQTVVQPYLIDNTIKEVYSIIRVCF